MHIWFLGGIKSIADADKLYVEVTRNDNVRYYHVVICTDNAAWLINHTGPYSFMDTFCRALYLFQRDKIKAVK